MDGVYPLATGGSPILSPTSLWAMANLVRESIMRSTSMPWSLKYSAMVVAVMVHLERIMADWLEVATTRTERLSPSSPKSL